MHSFLELDILTHSKHSYFALYFEDVFACSSLGPLQNSILVSHYVSYVFVTSNFCIMINLCDLHYRSYLVEDVLITYHLDLVKVFRDQKHETMFSVLNHELIDALVRHDFDYCEIIFVISYIFTSVWLQCFNSIEFWYIERVNKKKNYDRGEFEWSNHDV